MPKSKIKPNPDSWLRTINDMLTSGEFEFSREYLEDVRDYVEENDRITTKQTKAILNIRRSAQ